MDLPAFLRIAKLVQHLSALTPGDYQPGGLELLQVMRNCRAGHPDQTAETLYALFAMTEYPKYFQPRRITQL